MPEVTTPTLPVKIHGFRRLLSNRRVLLLSLIWFAGIVGTLPFLFRWPAPPPATGSGLAVRLVLGYSVAAALGYWMYRVEKPRLNRRNAAVLVFFIFLLAAISNQLHRYMVDYGKNAFGSIENTAWQVWLEDSIIQQSPAVAPHVYRFLPNSLVRWMQIGGLDFAHARDLYRLLFGLLLSYALYRYARLFTNYLGALIAMLLTAVVLPVSYQYYVGQLTDPMSHLSFVLAFIFLEKEDFPFLLTTLLIGSLAKESVLAMAGYYLLFGRRGRSYPLKAITLLVACPVIYFAIRLYILRGTLRYADISGVGIQHVMANFFDHRWPYLILLTGCSLMPLLVFGWRNTPDSLRWLPLYLFGALFFSSLFFSWLAESRNYMPMVFVLAVIGGYHLTNWASAGRGTADTPTAAASLRVTRQGRLQAATAGLRNTSAVTATEGAGMRWAIAFSAGVALLVASTLAVIIRTYSPLPKWDHWEEIVWLKSYYAGHWHFSDLLRQHNEHRLLFPRLFLLADWFLFRGRNIFVLLAILILQAGHAWVFIREVRVWKELPIAVRLTIISIVVALFFSGANLDNFSWPFQIQFILPFYAGTVALYALIRYAEQSAEGRIGSAAAGWLAVSAASGFVATYSLASGILIWPVLLVTGSFLRLKARILLLLGGIFGLLAVQYFSGYHQVAGHGSVLVALRHPFGILAYVGSYIALPVAKINRIVGTLVGLAALGGCAWAACRIVRRPLLSRLSVLSLGVMMYITAGAFITAVGRMGIASPEATFRYATPVCIFWVCTLLLAISETEGLRQRSIAIAAVLGTAIAGLVLAIVPLH